MNERKNRDLPKAGSEKPKDVYTVAILVIGNSKIVGVNASIQDPKILITIPVYSQSSGHAEADAVQQAVNKKLAGTAKIARFYEDRLPCGQCGYPGNQLRAMAKILQVDCLVVHVPGYEPEVYTPS